MTKPTPHYYPFGAPFSYRDPNRSWSGASRTYRYGFNGKEKDFETSSDNYEFGARIYDGRLGRCFSVDPLMKKHPDISLQNYNDIQNAQNTFESQMESNVMVAWDKATDPNQEEGGESGVINAALNKMSKSQKDWQNKRIKNDEGVILEDCDD